MQCRAELRSEATYILLMDTSPNHSPGLNQIAKPEPLLKWLYEITTPTVSDLFPTHPIYPSTQLKIKRHRRDHIHFPASVQFGIRSPLLKSRRRPVNQRRFPFQNLLHHQSAIGLQTNLQPNYPLQAGALRYLRILRRGRINESFFEFFGILPQ